VIDRETGKLISAGKFGKATWADHIDIATGRPVEAAGIRYEHGNISLWPSPAGAHTWVSMSFSPKTGLVYIPVMQIGAHFSRDKPQPGDVSVGGLSIGWSRDDPRDGKSSLVAYDPLAEKPRWNVPYDTFWNGGTLATAGNLVFQGTAGGYLNAYDATNGTKLWRFYAGLGINAAPMSYAIGGRQYVAVLVGYGGSASMGGTLMNVGWKYGAQPRRLLAFALDGHLVLPPSPAPNFTVNAVDDPKLTIDETAAKQGYDLFLACSLCHGRDLVAAGAPAPDLRESRIALDREALWTVLHDGTLVEHGMPRFETLSREQVMDIYAYIRRGAREAIEKAHAARGKT